MSYYTAITTLTWLTLAVMCILVRENGRLCKEDRVRHYVVYAFIAVSALAEWLARMLDGVECGTNPSEGFVRVRDCKSSA